MININKLNGGDITITTTPPATPSPYFTYDSNRVITGLYQGSPNVQEEGGWTYGGSNVVENYATAIGNDAFNDVSYAEYDVEPSKGVTGNITFQNVTSIGEWAFYYCNGLTNVTMPNVTNIGMWAFSGCRGLTSITIPDGVTSIEHSVFFDCSGLTSVTIGSGVTSIEDEAFKYCSNLTSVTIPNGVTSIGY